MTIAPETLAWLRQTAKFEGAVTAQVLLYPLERVEALEQRPIPGTVELATPTPEAAPVATDNGLLRCYAQAIEVAVKRGDSHDEAKEAGRRAIYDLGRQHGAAQPPAAQPAPPPAPAGGLVRRVLKAMWEGVATSDADGARAAIREVAAWMRENETGFNAARWLEQEADHG